MHLQHFFGADSLGLVMGDVCQPHEFGGPGLYRRSRWRGSRSRWTLLSMLSGSGPIAETTAKGATRHDA